MTQVTGDGPKLEIAIDKLSASSEKTEPSSTLAAKRSEKSMDDDTLVLYILMRTDLDSLNPGKAMAQANHAFGALKHLIRATPLRQKDYIEWQEQSPQGFGTTIVLGGDVGGIQEALSDIFMRRVSATVVAGWVHDSTYPIRDGAVTHLVPLNTCAFVFGTKAECANVCGRFQLHP